MIALLRDHFQELRRLSPAESCHVLDPAGWRQPGVTFWTLWNGAALAGCGAIKELDARHAELKSMRTAATQLRKGVASALLRHMIDEARQRGYRRLSLETGAMDYFEPARKLYERFGFAVCRPFGRYVDDPNSVFMTMVIH